MKLMNDLALIRLELETPVSVNNLYVPVGKGRMVLSQAGRDYKDVAGWKARQYMMDHGLMTVPADQEVAFFLTWYRQKRKGDLSNLLKCLEDAFSGIVYEDDEQIAHHELDRVTDPGIDKPYILVSISLL